MSFFGDIGKGFAALGTGGLSLLVTGMPGGDGGNGGNNSSIPQYNNTPIQPNSNIAGLRTKLDSMQAPGAVATEGPYQNTEQAYQGKDYSGALPEYDYQRNIADQQLNSSAQQNQDAIQRRFAAMGNLNSGAYTKAAAMSDQQSAQQRANTMQGIGFQEAQTRRGLQQQEANKEFQSQEAMKGRTFQGQQAQEQRNLQTNEFNQQQQSQFNQFKFGADSNLIKMDMDNQNAELDRRQKAFEAELAGYQAKHSGGLLGSGGILGTGLGSGMGGETGYGV